MIKKTIVISGINLYQAGPLSIFYDLLDSLVCCERIKNEYNVIAFVHKNSLFEKYKKTDITFYELPKSRKNYIFRYYYEYVFFKKFSKKTKVNIWISLHDITPNVVADNLFTYCHNPSPFRKLRLIDFRFGVKNILFPLFYKSVYKKNIKANKYVIVQQEWIRKEFCQMFHINNVVVSLPNIDNNMYVEKNDKTNDECVFFYPAYPRPFKNIETLCDAVKKLSKICNDNFKVVLTMSGTENKYSKYIKEKYFNVPHIEWRGSVPREEVFNIYGTCTCLVFPSLVETWGLPISEYKKTGKGMIVADLPYARETVGKYDNVSFFNPYSSDELCTLMKEVINKNIKYTGNVQTEYKKPFFLNWNQLINFILDTSND